MPKCSYTGTSEKRNDANVTKNLIVESKSLFATQSAIDDVLSTNHHSKDFIQTRNKYIVERLKLICLFFAISVPASSLLDFLIFESAQAEILLLNRIILSVALIMLYRVILKTHSIDQTRIVLSLSFLFPVLFYVATELSLTETMAYQDIPWCFSLIPFLIVTMLGLFPLTISGGLLMLAVITVPLGVLEYIQFTGDYVRLIDKLWLLLLFGGISLWLQTGQLVMLLKLYRESTIDPLTGLINRRVLMRQVEAIANNSNQHQQPFCVMMFDLDHFKRVNDNYGHMVGDKVLVKVASLLKRELRTSDVIARFGGEEFLVVMPHVELDQATYVALRVADAIRKASVLSEQNHPISFSSSIGVTQYRPNEAVASLFTRVDELLYQAKDLGRDRVESYMVPKQPVLQAS